MTPEELEAIPGIGPETVEKISLAVNNYFSSLEGGVAEAVPEAGEALAEGEAAPPEEAAAAEPVVEEPGAEASTEESAGQESSEVVAESAELSPGTDAAPAGENVTDETSAEGVPAEDKE